MQFCFNLNVVSFPEPEAYNRDALLVEFSLEPEESTALPALRAKDKDKRLSLLDFILFTSPALGGRVTPTRLADTASELFTEDRLWPIFSSMELIVALIL